MQLHRTSQIDYAPEPPGQDVWKSPAETLADGAGDCEDQVFYLITLLRAEGLDGRAVFGHLNATRDAPYCHVWVETEIDGQAWVLDPTKGFMEPRSRLPWFLYYRRDDLKTIATKLAEYQRRTGLRNLCPQYDRPPTASAPAP